MAEAAEIRLTIPGRPVPAVRMTKRGKHINRRAQSYLAYKDEIGWTARANRIRPFAPDVILEIMIRVYVAGESPGDWDNYGKSVCDALNGVAYDDDQQIKRGSVEVIHVDRRLDQRVEVVIRPLSA
ncbi:MAG: RusA family crossover junction endodeoxyribonuclease [Clostridia bacterium]|nr:RusA family crossover junction endodeoxyribonuclease [Clostridia bacterium]